MKKYTTKRLIAETQAIIRLNQFLRNEVGLKEDLSAKALKRLLSTLKKWYNLVYTQRSGNGV